MSTLILDKEHSVEVQCGDHLFSLGEGEDGTLYIEAVNCRCLDVSISDDDDPQVTARGTWVNIGIAPLDVEAQP